MVNEIKSRQSYLSHDDLIQKLTVIKKQYNGDKC